MLYPDSIQVRLCKVTSFNWLTSHLLKWPCRELCQRTYFHPLQNCTIEWFHWNCKYNFTFTKTVIKIFRDYNEKLNCLLCKFVIKYLIKKKAANEQLCFSTHHIFSIRKIKLWGGMRANVFRLLEQWPVNAL